VVLNPAPAAEISEKVLANIYTITPNETEAEILTGIKISDQNSAKKAGEILLKKGVENVIITLGAEGAMLVSKSKIQLIKGHKVNAVDTTAAGDTFNGAYVVALMKGMGHEDAIDFANKAAAVSVTRMGAQASCPSLADIEVLNVYQ